MATKEDILDSIASMTVLELSELLKEFEEKFGVARPPAAVRGSAPAAAPATEAEEEKDEFDVILTAAGDKKIQVIKEVRPHEPRPQGGQGPRRRCPSPVLEKVQGGRREGQGSSSKRPAARSSSSSRPAPTDVTGARPRGRAPPRSRHRAPGHDPLGGLARDVCDQVVVVVVVENDQASELGGSRDDQVNARYAVMAGSDEQLLHLDGGRWQRRRGPARNIRSSARISGRSPPQTP